MSDTAPLSKEQIDTFKSQGYLIVKNLLDEAALGQWRDQVWRDLDSSLETPETWPRDRSGLDDFAYDPPETAFGCHPALTAIQAQLGGGDFILGDGIPIIRWPEPDKEWRMAGKGHIDAFGGRWLPFMYGATAYLYDVETQGGGLMVWPGSHHTAHRYYRKHPYHIDGSFMHKKDFDWTVFGGGNDNDAVEFSGQAGDVVLWHAYLTHESSLNIRNSPRMALFARWDHRRRHDISYRYDVPEDLWKYWAI